MSLRQRLLLAVAAALFASLTLGTWITAWQAAHTVRAELSASLESGRRGVAAALQDMAASPTQDALLRLVSGFDGNQHVMAELRAAGQNVVSSRPGLPTAAPPAWFAAITAQHLAADDVPVPGGVIRLSALQDSEIGERWIEAGHLIGSLALSAVLAAAFCFATAAWSLRPLRPLAEALARLERGQHAEPLTAAGPPEIVHLATSFNRMQDALARAAGENRRLSEQLESLAEEERVELARDLHDEIGPLLFALTAWAAAARLQEEAGDRDAARASLQSLESAATSLQTAIRDLLRRLRYNAPGTTDLATSMQDLLDFWRGIRPQTKFSAAIAPGMDAVSDHVRAALFRVAQEGISNAVRHGNPTAVDVAFTIDAHGTIVTVQDNGTTNKQSGSGLGLIGLEERLQAIGGALEIHRGAGWRLVGRAPAQAPATT
jgi:two-component system, NarL family, sensor histidine kinase UhpB